MGSEPNRFLLQQQAPVPRRKRWGGCWGGLSCFRKQKGGKRIVPASRMPEGNAASNRTNGFAAAGLPNQNTGINPSLYAPPSSPASFSQSALPSTVQSPNCFLSTNSPGGPSSTMFITGPYAHETQLVSPPEFWTFTTEPSTAPLTPPPELAHLTTPSSPDVPYAHFFSSSANIRSTEKTGYISANDLQAIYGLNPGSPASTLRSSPASRTPEKEFTPQLSPSNPSPVPACLKSDSGRLVGLQTDDTSKARQDSNFFCPETFAQFYQDQSSLSQFGGRLSISKESEAYSNGGNGNQNRQSKISKPDPEELEAYRASFGFSADEIITTNHYVEISNLSEDSFSMGPLTSNKSDRDEQISIAPSKGFETGKMPEEFPSQKLGKAGPNAEGVSSGSYTLEGQDGYEQRLLSTSVLSDDDDDIFSNMGAPRFGRNYHFGLSVSDAEIEYRRVRSQREQRSWKAK